MRGVRIQAIVRELNDEKIDVIEWNPDPSGYIAKALSPARVTGVYLDEHAPGTKTATVVVPEDQLSLAIGRDGQNARLAAKLTAWRIDIKSLPEATSDALYRLQSDPEFAALAEAETDIVSQIEAILVKKDEGRPVTPEEYSILSQFVDRVERGIIGMYQAERSDELERIAEAKENIPAKAFEMPLEDLNFTERITKILIEAGYETVGDLIVQMELDSDAILGLNGIGPKTMENIEIALAGVTIPEPEIVEEEVESVEEEAIEREPEAIEEIAEAEAVVEKAEAEKTTDEPQVAEPETLEPILETTPVDEVEKVILEEADADSEDEEEVVTSFEKIFALEPDSFKIDMVQSEFEDEDEDEVESRKKKKKKKKFVEMEYDPDQDVVIVKRKRKRDEEGWEEDWDF
jgi:N utilization substance protein A